MSIGTAPILSLTRFLEFHEEARLSRAVVGVEDKILVSQIAV